MNRQPDVELVLRDYFADDGSSAPDHVLDVVEARIARQPRRSAWRLRGRPFMNTYAKLAVASAAVLLVAIVGYNLMPAGSATGGPKPTPTAIPTFTPTMAPTTTPTKALASTPALPAPAELQGRWWADIPPDVAILTFTATNFTIRWLGGDSGRIEVEGDKITFRGSPNPQCPSGGTYRWSIEGDKLHLEPVGTDPCPFQTEWAGNKTYTRSN